MGDFQNIRGVHLLEDNIMAKWGEGDPRWIVEDRPDATNVNNWHWYTHSMCIYEYHRNLIYGDIVLRNRSEKDASGWSKDKLKSLLLGLEFEGPEGRNDML